jgi:putative addiction module component (TIGR02574 family)
MNSTLEQVRQAALALPEEQRVQLVDDLIATLTPENAAPLDDAWLAEVERRSEAFDAGGVDSFSWDEVKERARRRCRPHA